MRKLLSLLLVLMLTMSMAFSASAGFIPETDPGETIFYGPPTITKHPTGEKVRVGAYAEFVARAKDSVDTIWHLVHPSGDPDIKAEIAPEKFPGLVVTGLNSERLGLDHIPKELDGWNVVAEFVSSGNYYIRSDPATINIIQEQLLPPTIYKQPMSVTLKPNQATTLQVGATASDSTAKLTYQWYSNTSNVNIGGRAIPGALAASYTPDYAEGTTYYYCVVRCDNGSEFVTSKTDCAAVTYEQIAVATLPTDPPTVPTAAPTVPTAPSTEPTAATVETTQAPVWATESTTAPALAPHMTVTAPRSNNLLLILILCVIAFIALLGILATVLILKLFPRDDDDEEEYYEPPKKKKPAKKSTAQKKSAAKAAPRKPYRPAVTEYEEDYEEDCTQTEDGWDDLSDLRNLNIYFDDEE